MTEQEIERKKHEIEILLVEREQAIREAAEWYRGWQQRQMSKGFRCRERT